MNKINSFQFFLKAVSFPEPNLLCLTFSRQSFLLVAKCSLDCGIHGRCEEGRCHCDQGGQVTGVTCVRVIRDAWSMVSVTTEPASAFKVGWDGTAPLGIALKTSLFLYQMAAPRVAVVMASATRMQSIWSCRCHEGWGGRDCSSVPQETECEDNIDNDEGPLDNPLVGKQPPACHRFLQK
ncbi:hypothetical protein CEXT_486101 [Caerostris extrusa]|uniref:EGF-like domain-containing protein n=1 Tax=Caerostris extrusa TaxID=172846 RepID=A0AAV4N1R1_CAEEX|nr:hypothetical protein CEXT_486101 [Caerostris extrusa]